MSVKLPVIISAESPDKPEEINDFIKQLLLLLNQHIAIEKTTERNCKLVLVELITNVIKHVKGFNNIVEIHIDEPFLKIIKTDNGPELELDQTISTEEELLRNYSVLKRGDIFHFISISHRLDEELHAFPEHFGLEIITKVAKNFTYRYDKVKRVNIFEVTICD